MSESIAKVSMSASPVARAGGGDLSERALGLERRALGSSATPPARLQRMHPKKLFSTPTPVSKFTCGGGGAGRGPGGPQLARIRSCLAECRAAAAAAVDARTRAASMEDLTPSKRVKKDSVCEAESELAERSRRARAAARVGRFMVVAAWRRRREEVLALRKTLDSKRSSAERLRVQLWALRSLLDADNGKVVLAIRELERLKRLLRDRDQEKTVLEREKLALEKDVSAAEDRASELSIGWRNSRNELEAARGALARADRERAADSAAAADARAQRDCADAKIKLLEEELSEHEALLRASEAAAAALRAAGAGRERALRAAADRLRQEHEARLRCEEECAEERARAALTAREVCALRGTVAELREELAGVRQELAVACEQLGWWPRPLTRMMGAARSLFRRPMSLREAVLWALVPARHGCY